MHGKTFVRVRVGILGIAAATGQQLLNPSEGVAVAAEVVRIIEIRGEPFFPIGLYAFPKRTRDTDLYAELEAAGFNLYLVPPTMTKDELDRAHAHGVRIMVTPRASLVLRGSTEAVAERKAQLLETLGPGSVVFEHPAVVAVEGPDEPLWVVKGRQRASDGTPQDLATWARTPEQQQEINELFLALKDGYAFLRESCGDRYSVWLNFAPRGDEDELRWFTAATPVGGYTPDPRPAADVFGTDIYPVPDGGGNNGWIRGTFVPSIAAVGVFTRKLGRAVDSHPFYMVLQGCGILEWDPKAYDRRLRRPERHELQFMVFQSIVNGTRGILIWGAHAIDDNSLYWRDIGDVMRQVRAASPIFLNGRPDPEARSGWQQLEVAGFVLDDARYVLAVNAGGGLPARVGVPGWRGARAYSLLDGMTASVENEIIHDVIEPFGVKLYCDGGEMFDAFHRPANVNPNPADKPPFVRSSFSLPTHLDPMKGMSPQECAAHLRGAGLDAVIKMPASPELVDALHAEGIRCYAEIACFAGKKAWEERPEARPVTAGGALFDTEGGYGGVCVCQAWHVETKLEEAHALLEKANWDGLWLDFIRWPGRWEQKDPKWDQVCFCDTCLAEFACDRAVQAPPELATTAEKAAWILENRAAEWYDWRSDRVADVVRRMRDLVKELRGSDAVLGIFAVPLRHDDYDDAIIKVFGQDWRKLAPYVDVFSPMVYHLFCGRPRGWIQEVTAEVAAESGKTLWPIVQSCSEPVEMSAEEFRAALEWGAKDPAQGVMIYSTRHTIEEGKWEAMAEAFRGMGGE